MLHAGERLPQPCSKNPFTRFHEKRKIVLRTEHAFDLRRSCAIYTTFVRQSIWYVFCDPTRRQTQYFKSRANLIRRLASNIKWYQLYFIVDVARGNCSVNHPSLLRDWFLGYRLCVRGSRTILYGFAPRNRRRRRWSLHGIRFSFIKRGS